MKLLHAARTVLLWYLALAGVTAHLALVIALWYAQARFDLGPRELARLAVEQAEQRIPAVAALLRPAPRHLDHVFDGRIRDAHPRILLPGLADWSGTGQPILLAERDRRYRELGIDPPSPCSRSLPGRTACWLSRGDTDNAAALLEAARRFEPKDPHARGDYGNAWQLAFAYDFLRLSPEFGEADRAAIEMKLAESLSKTLEVLDGPSPSLWHGRATLAASAWLIAVTLDPDTQDHIGLQRRAQGHFLDVMQAWELAEAWPEGYNYWAQSRAFLLTLAATAYLNGLEDAAYAPEIRETLRRAGYWHIYGTRPDHRAEGFGDEGSRVDLKDETQRVIDLMAQATRDSLLAAYSRYLQDLHGREGYYRDYRWGYRLFHDPELDVAGGREGLAVFTDALPRAGLFGRDSVSLGYIRSDWSDEATFIAFRAGHSLTHHGHYDAGHFTLFKAAPLAVNSSTYGDFTGSNRLNYSIRSIAKNTLLILRPDERVRPNHLFTRNVAGGGQRVTLPTGSGLRDLEQWRNNLDDGLYLRGGRIDRFEPRDGDYVYLRADLTDAYNTPDHDEGGRGGKVREVSRELVYLYSEDRLIVYDRIEAVDAGYVKKWLLHSVNRPELANTEVLAGGPDNGILESATDVARIVNGRGHLLVQRLLPADAVIRLVGGPDYQYYVETDGDERELDGDNFREGASHKPWFDVAEWRIEIQPGAARSRDRFLVALSPGLDRPRSGLLRLLDSTGNLTAVGTDDSTLIFVEADTAGTAEFTTNGARTLRVFGLPPGDGAVLVDGGIATECTASRSGSCRFTVAESPGHEMSLSW